MAISFPLRQIRILGAILLAFSAVPALSGPSTAAADRSGDRIPDVPIGTRIPDLSFRDIRALPRRLSELGPHKARVLVFSSTTCPLVSRTLPKLSELHSRFSARGVQVVVINVAPDDSIREMAAQAVDLGSPFPFVKDIDHSCVRAVGVHRTPEIAVLDDQQVLRYRGRIDDQLRLGGARPQPTRNDLETALNEILDGSPVTVSETPVDGCLISPLPDFTDSGPAPAYFGQIDAILFRHCAGCHRPESSAPFSLLTLEESVGHAAMIADVVRDETMPPWYASREHGTFQNDASLPPEDRRRILHWVAAGTPAGDPQAATPAPPGPSSEWRIGQPDLILTMLESHRIPATGFVDYRYSVLPHLFLEDTWIEAVEIRPLNPQVVHHCNMAYVTADGASEETFITGYVPGGQPLDLGRFENGVAFHIPKGAGLGLQIHYTTVGTEESCRIQVGLRFPRRIVDKQFRHFLLDPRGWSIPPGDPAFEVRGRHRLPHDATLLGLFTHMHVRGRDMTFFAETPDGTRTTLLQIPNYNFEWQLGYEIRPGDVRLPAGSLVEAVAHFDNSPFNPFNPDPSDTVRYGPQTIHEMFNGFVFYVADGESLNLKVDPQTGRAVEDAEPSTSD